MPANENEIYGASWSRLTRLLTLITTGLSLLPFAIVLSLGIIHRDHSAVIIVLLLITFAIPLIMTAIVARSSPRNYTLSASEVVVNRIGRDIVVPFNTIKQARLMDGREIFGSSVRSNASGGYFGFFGSFSSPGMGGRDFTAYATRIDGNLVVLDLKQGDPIVLSPDNPEKFVEVLQRQLASLMDGKNA